MLLSLIRTCRDALLALLVATLLLSLLGFVVRDRIVLLAPCMYLPGVPIAGLALLCDLIYRGSVLRGPRFQLTAVAGVTLLLSGSGLFGWGGFDRQTHDPVLRVMQWNLMWGGSWHEASEWEDITRKIVGRKPDLVILAETPLAEQHVETLRRTLGDEWQMVRHDHVDMRRGYFVRGRVLSRYPLTLEHTRSIPAGTLAVVTVETPLPLRLIVVDGISGLDDKTPMLHAIAEAITAFAPVDLVCGDFNAISQSHGFGGIRSQGFRDASDHMLTWRGTWPTYMPLYDLDHLMVSERHRVVNSRSFMSKVSDHRGQFADIQVGRP